ncbi:PDR/VanB family oxidoreductase [Burkholderia sp. PAMC 26561]|uniref:PDR/VanB family oxidoreductase n=1 Tax=Burkholderia sp. PAMC 26561 TaxID=1795043 RepID=UPI00076B03E0|nr:PDR/VanB family oxidoreductase [Burkholderia sp. PAMC 26561]AME28392.1 ferredoxin [Burkholderia sp. PAMC 26561]
MNSIPVTVRVDAIRDEAPDIRVYVISRIDGEPFSAYEPGAHIDVTSPSGVMRQYSLCGDPDQLQHYEFAVKHETRSRGGSRSLHNDVTPGTQLITSAPRNLFRLDDTATGHILMAAGIGITPLLSMAYRLLREHPRFTLHYFVRDFASAAFMTLLTESRFAEHVVVHYGVEPSKLRHEVIVCLTDVPPGTHVYTCGPSGFMDCVVRTGESVLPASSIHLERFFAESTVAREAVASFEVEIASNGTKVRVEPDQSIVDALASAGILIDTSCGEGVCGTCMVDVLSGEPEHRDHCLSKAERASGKVICCCVSRSTSPLLVLDL